MKSHFWICAGLLMGQVAMAASSQVVRSHRQEFKPSTKTCAEQDDCDLKRFTVLAEDYKVPMGKSSSYGSRMAAIFETRKISDLPRYGIVQFIRGCVFSSQVENGQVVKTRDYYRDYFGENIFFHHPEWVIDGVSKDPMDWGFEEHSPSRQFYYRWNSVRGSLEQNTSHYAGQKNPTNSMLFVMDHPGTVFIESGRAKNISLQFKTCLYKSADVPLDTKPEDLNFAQPIECFDWSSSFVYNHAKARFESPAEIDPVCLEPKP